MHACHGVYDAAVITHLRQSRAVDAQDYDSTADACIDETQSEEGALPISKSRMIT
jgi:hypothetical protein